MVGQAELSMNELSEVPLLDREKTRNERALEKDLEREKFQGWGVVAVAYVDGQYWGSNSDIEVVKQQLSDMRVKGDKLVQYIDGGHNGNKSA